MLVIIDSTGGTQLPNLHEVFIVRLLKNDYNHLNLREWPTNCGGYLASPTSHKNQLLLRNGNLMK